VQEEKSLVGSGIPVLWCTGVEDVDQPARHSPVVGAILGNHVVPVIGAKHAIYAFVAAGLDIEEPAFASSVDTNDFTFI
jgi:hypothetical protein